MKSFVRYRCAAKASSAQEAGNGLARRVVLLLLNLARPWPRLSQHTWSVQEAPLEIGGGIMVEIRLSFRRFKIN
jgi:hypothetical protein